MPRVSDIEACQIDAELKGAFELWRDARRRVWLLGLGMLVSLASIFFLAPFLVSFEAGLVGSLEASGFVMWGLGIVWFIAFIYVIDVKYKCDDVRSSLDKAIYEAVDGGFTVIESSYSVGVTRSPEDPDYRAEYIRLKW